MLASGLEQGFEDVKSGAWKGAANTVIDLTNFATDVAMNSRGGAYFGPSLNTNPFAIERFAVYSEREARVSVGVQLGLTFAPSAAAAPFAASSSLSIAPQVGTTGLQSFFPSNNGFLGATSRQFLYTGEQVDRFGGSAASRFFSPVGTPAGARSLPPGGLGQPLRTFQVMKPFEVQSGTVAPAFGKFGFGTQYRTPVPLETLLKRRFVKEVTQ